MRTSKTVKVVMLSTKKESNIVADDQSKALVWLDNPNSALWGFQHLYLVANDEIKNGDYCYDKVLNLTFTIDEFADFKYVNQTDNVLKIIATTDISLGLPLIPKSFVEAFVKKQGKITEANVEFDTITLATREDNTVIIHQAKTYSREDVEKLLEAQRELCAKKYSDNAISTLKWVKKSIQDVKIEF